MRAPEELAGGSAFNSKGWQGDRRRPRHGAV